MGATRRPHYNGVSVIMDRVIMESQCSVHKCFCKKRTKGVKGNNTDLIPLEGLAGLAFSLGGHC